MIKNEVFFIKSVKNGIKKTKNPEKMNFLKEFKI